MYVFGLSRLHKSLPNKLALINISRKPGIKLLVVKNAHAEMVQLIAKLAPILSFFRPTQQIFKSNSQFTRYCFHHLFSDTCDHVERLSSIYRKRQQKSSTMKRGEYIQCNCVCVILMMLNAQQTSSCKFSRLLNLMNNVQRVLYFFNKNHPKIGWNGHLYKK